MESLGELQVAEGVFPGGALFPQVGSLFEASAFFGDRPPLESVAELGQGARQRGGQ